MFRYVQLKIGRLDLGEPLSPAISEAAGMQPGALAAELPRGSFGRAEQIRLRLSPGGVLSSVEFAYPSDADFEKMIGDYVSLGEPTRESTTQGETTIDIARWSDADTELILTREVDGAGSHIRGELRDRKASIG